MGRGRVCRTFLTLGGWLLDSSFAVGTHTLAILFMDDSSWPVGIVKTFLEREKSVYKWLFQLDDEPNHYIKTCCFTKHPFKTGCLGYQVVLGWSTYELPTLHPASTASKDASDQRTAPHNESAWSENGHIFLRNLGIGETTLARWAEQKEETHFWAPKNSIPPKVQSNFQPKWCGVVFFWVKPFTRHT